MSVLFHQSIDLSRELSICKRRAVITTTGFCAAYILVTALYCYLYALYIGGDYGASFYGTLRCVSLDWFAWAFIAPLLAHMAIKQDISTQAGRLAIVRLLMVATALLALGRVATEHALGSDPLLETLLYFLPRYLFVTAFLVGAGIFYVYKSATELQIQGLKAQQAQHSAPKQEDDKKLVVYKGNCRAMVDCGDIISISANGNYLELETHEGSFLMRNTMKSLESSLDCRRFVRIHRSHIVNLEKLKSVSRMRLEANLSNGKVLRIGKKYLGSLPHFG